MSTHVYSEEVVCEVIIWQCYYRSLYGYLIEVAMMLFGVFKTIKKMCSTCM